MKRLFTFLFVVSVLSATVWAADWATTYEENYANATKAGVTPTVKSYTRKAHPCLEWSYLKVRIKGDTLLGKQAIWLNRNVSPLDDAVDCYLECAHIEGGVKNISFLYKQAHSGDDGKIICLALKADDVRLDSLRFTGESKYRTSSRTYSKALGIKSNAKLTLQNISHTSNTDYTIIPGRLTIGALTITPYLLYRQKDVTIGTKQQGYVNRELLDNTGGTETITYLSSDETIAQVNAETGVVTPIKAGNVTISASLDGGTTTITYYTLHVVDGILCENFSKVVNQTGSAPENTPWDGDLFGWTVNKARRFTNDTIYDSPRVQGTWLAENDGNVQSTNAVEGGVKHITFDWMQWSNVSSSTVKVLYGDEEKVVDAQTENSQYNHFTIDEDINGTSNAVLKISNASPSSPSDRITIGAIKITPYLLYTTKEATLDTRNTLTYTNTGLIDNTTGDAPNYEISPANAAVSINAEGQVAVEDGAEVNNDFIVTATWGAVTTTYTLHIISRTATTASYPNAEIHATIGGDIPANALAYTDGYDGEISYASSVPAVADFVNGVLTLKAPGQTKITATLPETSNYTSATASYLLTVSYTNYESFNLNTTTSTYAKPEENAQGDQCKWYVYIGGIKMPDYFSSNAITTRAQRANESKQGYAKSAKLSGGISALAFNYSMMFADNDIEKWDIQIYVNDRLVGQLTNEAGGDLEGINGRTLNPMRTKVITGINEPGRFVIRFENHSTVKSNVEYESGNKGRFAIDNVSWENYDGAIVLSESVDNSAVLAVNSGSTQDVEISRSELKGGFWNTLCLPFAMPVSTLGVVENGVQTLSGATLNADELTISFTAFTGETLEAGIPYLVKPASDIDISDTYSDKQITSIASAVNYGAVTLQGIFSLTPLKANDYSTLFVGTPDGEGNNLFYPSEDASLKGFRAYFKINEAMGAPIRHARFVTDQTNTATGSEEVRSETVGSVRSEKILENGQLIIIRDGVRYDVLGRKK